MNRRGEAGVSLIELLIALAIFSILSVVVFSMFRTALTVWRTSQSELQERSKLITSTPWLSSALQSASKIQYVTLADEPSGALQYTDSNAQSVSVFMNSRINQSRFGPNLLPSNNVVAVIQTNGVTSNPFPIFESVVTFSVETFREDPTSFRISTPNNLILPINYGAINSLRISVAISVSGKIKAESQLIRLSTDAIGTSETHTYGTTTTPFSDDTGQFTLTGTQLLPDQSGQNPRGNANGIALVTANVAAKIRHTGHYFTTIQSAINAASAGDIVMVASGTHSEFISMRANIDVQGGYDPVTWVRDPSQFITTIRPGPGAISNAVVRLASSSQLSGCRIEANNLLYGVSATSVTNASLRSVEIDRAEVGIRYVGSTGRIENCAITANTTALLADTNSSNLFIFRNRLASRGLAKVPTVKFQNTSNIQLRNNLVLRGFTGISAEATGAVIANNVVSGTVNNALTSQNRTGNNLQIINNIFVGNAFGIVGSSGDMTIIYNYFAQNGLGDGANSLFTGVGNIRDVTNTVPIGSTNDPIFASATTFVLKSNSSVIDLGNPAGAFNDRYTSGPGLGNGRADMGAYGGPNAGRIGFGTIHAITTAESGLQARISDTWPGDWVVFKTGPHSVGAITLRDGVTVMGQGPETTILNTSGTGGFALAAGSILTDLTLSSSTGTPISAVGVTGWILDGLVVKGANTGVSAAGSASGSIRNCTLYANKIGISASNSSIAANANIITQSDLIGVQSTAGADFQGKSNLFFNNTTDRSGTIALTNDVAGNPLFWDVAANNFFLRPGSPAIDASVSQPLLELGAFEFYEGTGTVTSPLYKSVEARSYKTISVTLRNASGDPAPDVDTRLTAVGLNYVLDGKSVTVSASAVSTENASLEYSWNLAPRAIGSRFQAKLILKSYKRESTPFVSNWTIKW